MTHRVPLNESQPDALNALLAVEKYLSKIDLDKSLIGLIKMRVSGLNGCGYCMQMHYGYAIEAVGDNAKLLSLPAWKESELFNKKERAVLALADEITLLSTRELDPKVYQFSIEQLGESLTTQAIMQIVQMNTWNRVAMATGMRHN